ncbi:MAG: HAMP domain-containing sensor histidine kinase [Patescibacteria group bacterium]
MDALTIALIIICIGELFFIFYLVQRERQTRVRSIKKMEERRSNFVSIISHQLRTPLSVIKGYLEGLVTGDQGAVSPGQKEYLDDALKVSRETIELVNDYLNIVKLDPEKMELNRQTVQLADIVRAEIDKMQTLARASNCTIELAEPPASLPPIQGDAIKLRQVVENILANAIKYTSGKGKVAVSLKDRDGSIVFSCRDNGVGIPDDEQEAIFTKFFRARNILHKNTTGSGLGLYLARVIVGAHGGEIWFQSKEGAGTTVYVSLPKHSPSTQ